MKPVAYISLLLFVYTVISSNINYNPSIYDNTYVFKNSTIYDHKVTDKLSIAYNMIVSIMTKNSTYADEHLYTDASIFVPGLYAITKDRFIYLISIGYLETNYYHINKLFYGYNINTYRYIDDLSSGFNYSIVVVNNNVHLSDESYYDQMMMFEIKDKVQHISIYVR